MTDGPGPGRLETDGETLLREADREAERIVSIVRMGTAAALMAAVIVISSRAGGLTATVGREILYAKVTLGVLFVAGFLAWNAVRAGIWRPWITFATVTTDALLVMANLYVGLRGAGLPGNFAAAMPIVGTLPVILATSALRLRPAVQVYTTALLVSAAVAVGFAVGHGGETGVQSAERSVILYAPEPNAVRVLMLVLAGTILVVGAVRGRQLLRRAIEETSRRVNLARFLPRELAPLLAAGRLQELRQGRRAHLALLFVDIRDSTSLAETLDPGALAALIGAFRARVSGAAATHGGVVDKFIGDGAFLVFGLPEPFSDGAARALACGRDILEAVDEWSRELGPSGPVRIGIGVHWGECFAGVVGDEARLEFTVLGDAVNVASRIEQATKTYGQPLLVSRQALDAAGADESSWRLVSAEPPRGRSGSVALYAPVR